MAENGPKKRKCGFLSSISYHITYGLETFFYRLGKAIGRSPWWTILICVIVTGLCAIGVMNFTQESRSEKLWVPEDSQSLKEQDEVGEMFPSRTQPVIALLVGDNILTPKAMSMLYDLDEEFKKVGNNSEKSWGKICVKAGPSCLQTSVLDIWGYNGTKIKSLTQAEILSAINAPVVKSMTTNRPMDVVSLLGGITKDSGGKITGAEALQSIYISQYNPVVKDNRLVDEKNSEWQEAVGVVLDKYATKVDGLELMYFSSFSFRKASGESISGDVVLLSAGYFIIIFYVALMLGRLTMIGHKVYLAILGVVCVGMSIGICFGLSSAFNIIYGPVHSILPFLLLGIGVDDMFVIVQAWNNIPKEIHAMYDIPERVGLALRHAGSSITITSLTDCVAFLTGGSTVLPALSSFCFYAAIGIVGCFFLQSTFFVAWVAIDARRYEKRRDACCCILLSESYTPSKCGDQDRLQVFFERYFSTVLLKLPTKIFVIILTATLLGFNLYGTLMLKQDFDFNWFLPSDSMAAKYSTTNTKFFPDDGIDAAVYIPEDVDYFASKVGIRELYKVTERDSSVSTTDSWFEDYLNWVNTTYNGQGVLDANGYPKNASLMNQYAYTYINGAGKSEHGNDVKFKNVSGEMIIGASRIPYKHKKIDESQDRVKAIGKLRDDIYAVDLTGGQAFAYGRQYISVETDKVIAEELYRNLGIAMAVVFVLTLVVLANLWTSLACFICVGLTLVDVMGTMYWWGLTIDTVTTIQLILAVGLAVDYASHIGHTFMVSLGTRQERARRTIQDIGTAVWNGGFSTFLAFVLLATSSSYVFTVFFKVFFSVVLFGMYHGICFLPVVLSAIGPEPYETAVENHKHENRKQSAGRLSPVHPAQEPKDSDSSDVIEFRPTSAKREVAEVHNKDVDSVKTEQPLNVGYTIPPVDYNNKEGLSNGNTNQGYEIPPVDYTGGVDNKSFQASTNNLASS